MEQSKSKVITRATDPFLSNKTSIVKGDKRAMSGRPKGVPNKYNRDMRKTWLQVFEELGGTERMIEWANADPKHLSIFYKGCLMLLPKTIVGDEDNPITFLMKDAANSAREKFDAILNASAAKIIEGQVK